MIVDPQTAAIALMSDPHTHAGAPVERITTHISQIFLAGNRAWKMKRAVKLRYVDFSTPRLRLAACLREVELNAQTAPNLYYGVHRLTSAPDGRLSLDGDGELIDAVIEMRRFDQHQLFDKMALAGVLNAELMTRVAWTIHRFHDTAPVAAGASGAANLALVLEINEAGFRTSNILPKMEVAAFTGACRSALAKHADLLDRRAKAGKVRRCHGDLHLRNICLLDGEPRLFDCIEFNDAIATVDVLYDLAFLLMDLWHRGLTQLANLVANCYFDAGEDEDAYPLMVFLMAVRASIRAHVIATQAQDGGEAAVSLGAEAASYLDLGQSLLREGHPCLITIGGLSGSGKSTVAEALAPKIGMAPGARIIESDRVRKGLFGVAADVRLPTKAYSAEVSRRVYTVMAEHAGKALASGGVVVADAVFNREDDRISMEAVASRAGTAFHGFWLEADPNVLRQRVAARISSASDATIDVLEGQLRTCGKDAIIWTKLDATLPAAVTVESILKVVEAKSSGAACVWI